VNVLVVTNLGTFAHSPAQILAGTLVRALNTNGVNAENMGIPAHRGINESLVDAMLMFSMIEIANVDLLIGLEFPSCLVRASKKSIWLFDGIGATPFETASQGNAVERAAQIHRLACDRLADCLSVAQRAFVATQQVGSRIKTQTGRELRLLHPPLDEAAAVDWRATVGALLG
jgi:hypothetical protein